MGLQPTASKTALLLQCTRPFASDTECLRDEPGEAALYGTAFHTGMFLKFFPTGEPPALEAYPGLAKHVASAYKALKRWMKATGNPFGESFKVVSGEQPVATRFSAGGVAINRPTTLAISTHHYALYEVNPYALPDAQVPEMGGTPDLILRGTKTKRIVVLDHKTGQWGQGFFTPARMPQMRTLALQTGADIVAVLHAPRGMPPTVYAEELSIDERASHGKSLNRQLKMIDEGYLRPGPECRRCPAKSDCPAFSATLMRNTTKMVKAVTGSDLLANSKVTLGEFHMMLGQLDALAKRARAEIKERVRAGEVIERPDGKVLALTTFKVERLSKSSILKNMGSTVGGELLDKLRDAGAMTEADEERLVAK